jgi:recombination protein RecT
VTNNEGTDTMSATQAGPPTSTVRSLADLRQQGVHKQTGREAGGTTVEAFFTANKASMAAMLPKHMDANRMVKIALRALRTTPKLMECTLESLMASVISCASLGLEPNTPLGHAYLIPFNNRRKVNGAWQDVPDVQVVIGYKGMVDLARRSGEIISISTRVVYENDPFEIEYGLDEKLFHKPAQGDRGKPVGAYAVAKLKGGGFQWEHMTLEELHDVRNASQGYAAAVRAARQYNSEVKHPWATNEEEMMRKTPLRRLFKMLPISIELASALTLDERETGSVGLEKVLDGVDYTEVAAQEQALDHDLETGEVKRPAQEPQEVKQDAAPKSELPPPSDFPGDPNYDPNFQPELISDSARRRRPWLANDQPARPDLQHSAHPAAGDHSRGACADRAPLAGQHLSRRSRDDGRNARHQRR